MSKVAIVTDSNSGITQQQAEELGTVSYTHLFGKKEGGTT